MKKQKKFSFHLTFIRLVGTVVWGLLHFTFTNGTEYVIGVTGKKSELPCYLSSPDPNDEAILALWYKQGRRLPVYSYDARGAKDRHQKDQEVLQSRGSFITSMSPALLVFDPVLSNDAGVYTCRVDYMTSPTHNTVVNFTVIEPPEIITIYDYEKKKVEGKTQPINEGAPLFLSCVVEGGRPQPTVSWWSENRVENFKSEVNIRGHIQADLRIPEVTRSFDHKVYSCHASNYDREPPLTKKIAIAMNLRPLSAVIKIPSQPLVVGKQYVFTCEVKGSKPTSKIVWYLDGNKIDRHRTQTRPGKDELTIGHLDLVLREEDHGSSLKCEASNPAIDGSDISHTTLLDVHYPPNVTLELGSKLDPKAIKQGVDVYFECLVKANPKPFSVTWFKDGVKIFPDIGVFFTDSSLVLQKVLRKSAGKYMCQASNLQGTKLSNSVQLDVMFPPECLMDEPSVLAVGRGETVNITCRVASNPLKAMFHWQLNGSERSFSSPGRLSHRGDLTSRYNFVGTNDKDYGALLCWANNSVGTQQAACIFNIIPAGPPSAPEDCGILNQTAENIEVSCKKGFSGGLTQAFLAEVFDEGGNLHLNASSEEPQFSFPVDSLRSGATYTIRVTSINEKGSASSKPLTAYTLKVAEKRMGEAESLLYSPLIIIFLSILGGFVVIIIVLVLVTRWRKNISNSGTTILRSPACAPPLPKEALQSSATKVTGGMSPTATRNLISKEAKGALESEQVGCNVGLEKVRGRPKKKQVMVVENGKIERPGVANSQSPDEPTPLRDAVICRQREEGFLPNGGSGYYNSIGKTSLGLSSTTFHSAHSLKSPSYSSSYSSPTYSGPSYSPSSSSYPAGGGSLHHSQTPAPPYTRTLPAQPILPSRLGSLPPLVEEYGPPQPYHHRYSSLPRKRSIHGSYLRDEENPVRSSSTRASVEDRYHLMHGWKENPKYLIRTHDRENEDESFV